VKVFFLFFVLESKVEETDEGFCVSYKTDQGKEQKFIGKTPHKDWFEDLKSAIGSIGNA